MCTVLFIPDNNRYFFASLRDESPQRVKASPPSIIKKNNIRYLAPVDPVGGGTWLGANESGNVIILLNGAFENHRKSSYYRKSRGLIVSELLATEVPVIEWSLIDLDDIEPYSLIVWTEGNLFQLVWDGKERHRIKLDTDKPYIWSSATLYDKKTKELREELFQNWIAMNPPVSKLSVLNFLKSFSDNENGFIMNRNEIIKTLSYSFIELNNDNAAIMSYYDFMNFSYHNSRIDFKFFGNIDI